VIPPNPAQPYDGGIALSDNDVASYSRGIYDACPNHEQAQLIAPPHTITACVCENLHLAAPHVYERDMARRWHALAPHTRLPLSDGESCTLLFAGLPGGAAGPDVQDTILAFPDQRIGAVEFHRRASDWYAHQHHRDARYNGVILHVVLTCDMLYPALRQNGTAIPTCSLHDLVAPILQIAPKTGDMWPCQQIILLMSETERAHLLWQAGILRFEQKAYTFVEHIHNGIGTRFIASAAPYSLYDICLLLALAEGLGYGRDRAFFRAAGARLLGLADVTPEPLGLADQPPRLDAHRLSALRKLIEAWRDTGGWNMVRDVIIPKKDEQLRALFMPAGISTSRADILICNVMLPFAHAVGLVENDVTLAQAAKTLYLDYPSLSSNRVTRAMTRQLLLSREPSSACQQQGLHYIYQQTCQEKRCEQCIAGRRVL
jgi:hypothetical protein